jgi:hypothetical protein
MPPRPAKTPATTLAHRIHALLHTVRHIAHFEDELCTLLHAAEHSGASVAKDLHSLLTRIPSDEYLHDLEALSLLLSVPTPRRPQAAKQLSSKPRQTIRAKGVLKKSKPTPQSKTKAKSQPKSGSKPKAKPRKLKS